MGFRIISALAAVTVLALTAPVVHANDGLWQDVPAASIATRGQRDIRPREFRTVALNDARLAQILGAASAKDKGGPGVILALPMPDGAQARFEVFTTPVMAPELAARYPGIRTYAGHGVDDKGAWVRLDRTPAGFHAMLHTAHGTVYIDPYQRAGGKVVGNIYQSYAKSALTLTPDRAIKCDVHEHKTVTDDTPTASRIPTGPVLRTYRLAVATTGEYAQFHGGTVPLALAEIVTAINRVNGLYEAQLAVRLEIIANNDQLIFLNAATDGYTNNNGFQMLSQNQARIDAVIGSANYDIGHVFSTGGGGIAGLGVVCRGGNKARGVTGLPQPIGDPFYVDFVSHEIGHQFGGNHTFNGTSGNCASPNRNGSTAYEPGSGSTIMAYAGICGAHNIANSADEHFHTISFQEIVAYSNTGFGNTCAAQSSTGNQAPIVDAGTTFTVPLDTPLRLTGSAVDPDGDPLVYRWEQFDLGPGGSPNNPTGNAPLFRSFPAENDPTRVLPRLNDILTDSQTVGERLPTYARSMRFRLTALDQRLGGGGVDNDVVTHFVSDAAGPFDMTSQNITTIWTPGETETITWNVANTDQAPINCSEVNILFSADIGNNFDTPLALFTPNDGSHDITVPNIQTNVGRVMVECANNIFFDINNVNIRVLDPPNPDFLINVAETAVAACPPDSATASVEVESLAGFNGPVTLSASGAPAGVSASFNSNPVNAGGSTQAVFGNLGAAAAGDYSVTVSGTGSTGTRSDTFTLQIGPGLPAAPTLSMPVDGATNVAASPMLSWLPAAGATGYLVEIALDSGFGNIIYSASEAGTSHIVADELVFATVYHWRVTAQNLCGDVVSTSASFTTVSGPALVCAFPFATIPESGAPLTSTVSVPDSGTIVDVNVIVDISHGVSGHLVLDLTNEATGTTVSLMDQPGSDFFPGGCPTPDVDAVFNDDAPLQAEITCNASAPGLGPDVAPDQALSSYNGQTVPGDWTLTARDGTTGTLGTLNQWCVEVFYDQAITTDTDDDGIIDSQDNCTLIENPDQRDSDGDGFGNVCDADLNNDLVINVIDLGLLRTVFFTNDADADFNGDGVVNVIDLGIMRTSFFGAPGPSGLQ